MKGKDKKCHKVLTGIFFISFFASPFAMPRNFISPPILSFWLRHSANLLFSFCSIFWRYFWKLGDLPPACLYLKNTFFEKIKIKQKAEHVQAMFPKQVPLCRIFFLLRSKVRLGLGSCAYECFTCSVLSWCTVLGCTRCTYYYLLYLDMSVLD